MGAFKRRGADERIFIVNWGECLFAGGLETRFDWLAK